MKKLLIPAGVMAVLLAVLFFTQPKAEPKMPFADLKAEDIAGVTVQLLPPDETLTVTDIEELVDILKQVVIYSRDNAYKESCGQAVIYTITMNDGRSITVNAYNPFMVIDGTGYRTKYEPCERLSEFANSLAGDPISS